MNTLERLASETGFDIGPLEKALKETRESCEIASRYYAKLCNDILEDDFAKSSAGLRHKLDILKARIKIPFDTRP